VEIQKKGISEMARVSQKRIDKGCYWEQGIQLVSGCTKIGPGCFNCWAQALEDRFSGGDHKVRFHPDRLERVLRRQKPTTFAIWNDLFHEQVQTEWIHYALTVMAAVPRHRYLVCTKRTGRMREYDRTEYRLASTYQSEKGEQVIYFGTTVEHPTETWRATYLNRIPGIKRFLSIEPLLAPVLVPIEEPYLGEHVKPDQVIIGGESGAEARVCKASWIKKTLEDARQFGIPVFLKQLGQYDGEQRHPTKRSDPQSITEAIGECPRELIWK
jgi:protein gp37